MTRRARAALTAVMLVVVTASACASGSHSGTGGTASATTAAHTETFVTIGAGETLGYGSALPFQYAWPRLVFREAFPRTAVFVNAAVNGATAADAMREQVPIAVELHADVVAVWLGTTELAELTPPATFEQNLRAVVESVRSSGTRVLLADLPSYPNFDVRPFNAVIDRVARDDNVTLVPLRDVRVTLQPSSQLFLPDQAGHRAIATAFDHALAASK